MVAKLKWGMEYKGYLVSTDAYMNLQARLLTGSVCAQGADVTPCPRQLASTEEYIDGQFTGNLGEVLIRCDARSAGQAAGLVAKPWVGSTGLTRCGGRCNNVLYLRAAPQEEDEAAAEAAAGEAGAATAME